MASGISHISSIPQFTDCPSVEFFTREEAARREKFEEHRKARALPPPKPSPVQLSQISPEEVSLVLSFVREQSQAEHLYTPLSLAAMIEKLVRSPVFWKRDSLQMVLGTERYHWKNGG